MQPVDPIKPLSCYIGGKLYLAKVICPIIQSLPHRHYAEPFVGMGGIFCKRKMRPDLETINDINADLIALFRNTQQHYPQLLDVLHHHLASRVIFQATVNNRAQALTELQRAAQFFYVQKLSYGGKVISQNFKIDRSGRARFDMATIAPLFDDWHTRLQGVGIENLPYAAFIRRHDDADTLFYLDPPYWGSENVYGAGIFKRDDFAALRDLLAGIKGKFLMSLNDLPQVREMFAEFHLRSVRTKYTLNDHSNALPASELVIANCPLA